jgi:phage-related protein
LKTFNFNAYGDVKRTIRYMDRTIDFETGTFQVQRIGVRPIITFEGTYQGSAKKMKEIEDFYNQHRKSERFLFPYDGVNYTCQFTSDFSCTDSFGYTRGEVGNIRVIVKKQVSLTMRVVNI